ncbi:Nudix (Nucleoside diphosphate linked moiety X)-type motif 1 [Mortierella sp. AD094]|nr:Nudix (Nucleoside diphosphate linked moiety X)-type motif 1 [Mortierella sp. AD094]
MTIPQESHEKTQEQCIQHTKEAEESDNSERNDSREDEFNLKFLRIRKIFTLIFIHDIEHNQLLLGQKQRGALLGQWNGFGGKVERGLESIAESAARELKEEAFIKAPLFPIGFIQWVVTRSGNNNCDDKTAYPYRDIMIVYKAHSLERTPSTTTEPDSMSASESPAEAQTSGRITEFEPSDEMAPAWWDVDLLPWDSMRINHKVWYPFMLADRPYRGVYWYQTTRANVAATDRGDGAEKNGNAQRENAQEIWVEDLEKRRFQFGTRPIGGRLSDKDYDDEALEGFSRQVGVSGTCYSSIIDSVVQENRHNLKQLKSEPTPNQHIDEGWLLTAIARAEQEWSSS